MLAAAFIGMAAAAIAVALRTRYELYSLHAIGVLNDTGYVFRLYHSTLSRIDQLALGILAAVLAPWFNAQGWARKLSGAKLATWIGLAMAAAALIGFPQIPVMEFFVLGVIFAAMVLWAQRPATRTPSTHPIERAPLALLTNAGKLSFGLYLFHPFTRWWVQAVFRRFNLGASVTASLLFLVSWLAITWVLADVSYRFLEGPLLDKARARVAVMLSGARGRVSPAPQAAA
jgi:peptidoglycan/LPS O-acetylase OafA/YrhL